MLWSYLLYIIPRDCMQQDKIQHERAAYVADMKARMQSMDAEMQQIEGEEIN